MDNERAGRGATVYRNDEKYNGFDVPGPEGLPPDGKTDEQNEKTVRTVLAGFETALLLIMLIVSAFLNAVRTEAVQMDLYGRHSRAAVAEMLGNTADEQTVSAYIGLDAEAQEQVAACLSAYMRGDSETLPAVLSEKEKVHMSDVRALIRRAESVSRLLLGFAAVLVLSLAWLAQRAERPLYGAMCIGAAAGAGLLFGAVFFVTKHFDAVFVEMHKLLFTNDYWLMDPQTEILIRMMPANLFENRAVSCLVKTGQQAAVIALLLVLLYIFMRRLIQRWVNG